MGIINARMSDRSFRSWQKYPSLIVSMLSCFNCIFAQSEDDAARLRTLGATHVLCLGNLKYDAALLPCDESRLQQLKKTVDGRPLWLAASTHPGEEAIAARVHAALARKYPKLLTVIVPRHPERGAAVAAEIRKYGRSAQRSKQEPITADTAFYLADTLGELGLFYRLCEIVFMGGSLVAHGGQNPLEPARLACGIITGPHTENFSHIYWDMEQIGACRRVSDAASLVTEIDQLLSNLDRLDAMQSKVRGWMEGKGGTADRLVSALEPALAL
jgi:3-deoxy-D-manno-octulosonic-acid transferase